MCMDALCDNNSTEEGRESREKIETVEKNSSIVYINEIYMVLFQSEWL